MTTIAFYKGVLYTDSRRVLQRSFPLHILVEDKPFGKAHGVAIENINLAIIASDDMDTTLSQRQAMASCLTAPPDKIPGLLSIAHGVSKDEAVFGNTLVITRKSVYLIHAASKDNPKEESEVKAREVTVCDDSDWPIVIGAGRNYAAGYLVGGGDPRRLMEFVSRHESATGPDTYIYNQKDLSICPASMRSKHWNEQKDSK